MKPDTSIEAFDALDATAIRHKIKMCLKHRGDQGGTTEEIASDLKLEDDQVWKRMSEIPEIGRNGVKRKMKSGRNGFVWYYGIHDNKDAVHSIQKGKSDEYVDKKLSLTVGRKLMQI